MEQTPGPKIVLPGDLLPPTASGLLEDGPTAPVIKLGPGLHPMDDDTITAVKAGVLKHSEIGNRWWVESNQRRVCRVLGAPALASISLRKLYHIAKRLL